MALFITVNVQTANQSSGNCMSPQHSWVMTILCMTRGGCGHPGISKGSTDTELGFYKLLIMSGCNDNKIKHWLFERSEFYICPVLPCVSLTMCDCVDVTEINECCSITRAAADDEKRDVRPHSYLTPRISFETEAANKKIMDPCRQAS